MPYHLKRKGDMYFVVDSDCEKQFKTGMTKEKARKKMAALNMAMAREKAPAAAKKALVKKAPAAKKAPAEKKAPAAKKAPAGMTGLKTAEEIEKAVIAKEKLAAPTAKDHMDTLKKERESAASGTIPLNQGAVEAVEAAPKKKRAPKAAAEPSDDGYSKMSAAKRKELYATYHERGMMADEVPKEARRGYGMYLKKL